MAAGRKCGECGQDIEDQREGRERLDVRIGLASGALDGRHDELADAAQLAALSAVQEVLG